MQQRVPPTQKPTAHMARPNVEFTAGVRTERAALRAIIRNRMKMASCSELARSIYQSLLNQITEHSARTQKTEGGEGRR
jgi:hypothetical protein